MVALKSQANCKSLLTVYTLMNKIIWTVRATKGQESDLSFATFSDRPMLVIQSVVMIQVVDSIFSPFVFCIKRRRKDLRYFETDKEESPISIILHAFSTFANLKIKDEHFVLLLCSDESIVGHIYQLHADLMNLLTAALMFANLKKSTKQKCCTVQSYAVILSTCFCLEEQQTSGHQKVRLDQHQITKNYNLKYYYMFAENITLITIKKDACKKIFRLDIFLDQMSASCWKCCSENSKVKFSKSLSSVRSNNCQSDKRLISRKSFEEMKANFRASYVKINNKSFDDEDVEEEEYFNEKNSYI
ncbi:hypothetical protein X798_05060 [Onchocerca flexuosa]|uniref:Uncharacterized protein n=1 Tax=Onchocerca flexuosa TaxID=387005 RepID=A0A238BRN6_9BILA|nr:hypothetical protein X798_05060 [Onchocerca flexuosa]